MSMRASAGWVFGCGSVGEGEDAGKCAGEATAMNEVERCE